MRKFKFFIDYNKEEEWLTEMAKKGYELTKASFGYQFKESKPKDENIRIDYRTFKSYKDFIDYCMMFEDSGWKHISGTKSSGTQYFKKIKEGESDDIFSDVSSKAGRYKRLSNVWLTIAISYIPLVIALISSGSINVEAMLNPRLLYYTPGLWDKNGFDFLRAFLFETPFALMRGFIWLIIPTLFIIYIYFFLKAQRLYKDSQKTI